MSIVSGNLFVAVGLSDVERHALAASLTDAGLSRVIPGKRTRAANWHITVRFVGEATEVAVDRLAEKIGSSLDAEPGRVWVCGLGAFPQFTKASVMYAAIDDPSGLLGELAVIAEEACTEVGFDPEGRPFVPHLTLSRIRPTRDVSAISDALDDIRVPIRVQTLTMFRTQSTREGPMYVPLHEFPLGH